MLIQRPFICQSRHWDMKWLAEKNKPMNTSIWHVLIARKSGYFGLFLDEPTHGLAEESTPMNDAVIAFKIPIWWKTFAKELKAVKFKLVQTFSAILANMLINSFKFLTDAFKIQINNYKNDYNFILNWYMYAQLYDQVITIYYFHVTFLMAQYSVFLLKRCLFSKIVTNEILSKIWNI